MNNVVGKMLIVMQLVFSVLFMFFLSPNLAEFLHTTFTPPSNTSITSQVKLPSAMKMVAPTFTV